MNNITNEILKIINKLNESNDNSSKKLDELEHEILKLYNKQVNNIDNLQNQEPISEGASCYCVENRDGYHYIYKIFHPNNLKKDLLEQKIIENMDVKYYW